MRNKEHAPVTFLYIGKDASDRKPETFRLSSPHLEDAQAKEDFGTANHLAEEAKIQSFFVYRHREPNAIQDVWQVVQPLDMIIAAESVSNLEGIDAAQLRYEDTEMGKIAHLTKQW